MISDVLVEMGWALDAGEDSSTVTQKASGEIEEYLKWPPSMAYSGEIRKRILVLNLALKAGPMGETLEAVKEMARQIAKELDAPPGKGD